MLGFIIFGSNDLKEYFLKWNLSQPLATQMKCKTCETVLVSSLPWSVKHILIKTIRTGLFLLLILGIDSVLASGVTGLTWLLAIVFTYIVAGSFYHRILICQKCDVEVEPVNILIPDREPFEPDQKAFLNPQDLKHVRFKKLKITYHHWMAVAFENHMDHIAVKHVASLAQLNDDWGLLCFSHRFQEGKSVVKDKTRAMFYLKKVYNNKSELASHAAFGIGCLYFEKSPDEFDNPEAVHWFKVAAELGYPEAQYNYGLSLVDSWLGIYDQKEGRYWIEKAAKQGLQRAKNSLELIDRDYNSGNQ